MSYVPVDGIRIDRLLFFLRLAKSRTLAQSWAEAGHIRINGRRIERSSAMVHVGDVMTFPKEDAVIVAQLVELPLRRGPLSEAKACYLMISDSDKDKK